MPSLGKGPCSSPVKSGSGEAVLMGKQEAWLQSESVAGSLSQTRCMFAKKVMEIQVLW